MSNVDFDSIEDLSGYKLSGKASQNVSVNKTAFSDYGPFAMKVLDGALNWGANLLRDEAALAAPVGTEEHHADGYGPGHLADSHETVRLGEMNYDVEVTAPYSGWVHDGTAITHQVPRPWLANKFVEIKPRIIAKIKQSISYVNDRSS